MRTVAPEARTSERLYAPDVFLGALWGSWALLALLGTAKRFGDVGPVMARLTTYGPGSALAAGVLVLGVAAARRAFWALSMLLALATFMLVAIAAGALRLQALPMHAINLATLILTLGLVPARLFGKLGPAPR